MAVRNKKGQFEKGASGNENGRPSRKAPSHRKPAFNRNAVFAVAEMQREVIFDGQKRLMTLYEAALLRMAIAAANGDRVACQKFVSLVDETATRDLSMRLATKQLMAEMDETKAENERLRQKLERRTGVVVLTPVPMEVPPEARLDDGRISYDDAEGLAVSASK